MLATYDNVFFGGIGRYGIIPIDHVKSCYFQRMNIPIVVMFTRVYRVLTLQPFEIMRSKPSDESMVWGRTFLWWLLVMLTRDWFSLRNQVKTKQSRKPPGFCW